MMDQGGAASLLSPFEGAAGRSPPDGAAGVFASSPGQPNPCRLGSNNLGSFSFRSVAVPIGCLRITLLQTTGAYRKPPLGTWASCLQAAYLTKYSSGTKPILLRALGCRWSDALEGLGSGQLTSAPAREPLFSFPGASPSHAAPAAPAFAITAHPALLVQSSSLAALAGNTLAHPPSPPHLLGTEDCCLHSLEELTNK